MPTPLESAWTDLTDTLRHTAPTTMSGRVRRSPDLAVAETTLGLTLGNELGTWFGLVAASTIVAWAEVLPGNVVLDLDAAVRHTEQTRRIWGAAPPRNSTDDLTLAGTVAWKWLPEYVYIGTDGSGGGLFVDLRHGPLYGCVRWWDEVDADGFRHEHVATSITALVQDVDRALRGGPAVQGWSPVVDDDGLVQWES